MISRWGLNGPALTCDFPPGHCLGSGRGQDGLQSRDQIRQVPADGLPEFFVINLVVNWRSRLSIKQLGLSQDGGSPVVLPVVFEGAPIEQVHRPPQHVFQHQFLSPSARRRSISITKEMTRGKVLYTFYVAVPSICGTMACLRRSGACSLKVRAGRRAGKTGMPRLRQGFRRRSSYGETSRRGKRLREIGKNRILFAPSQFYHGFLASWRLGVFALSLGGSGGRQSLSTCLPCVRISCP